MPGEAVLKEEISGPRREELPIAFRQEEGKAWGRTLLGLVSEKGERLGASGEWEQALVLAGDELKRTTGAERVEIRSSQGEFPLEVIAYFEESTETGGPSPRAPWRSHATAEPGQSGLRPREGGPADVSMKIDEKGNVRMEALVASDPAVLRNMANIMQEKLHDQWGDFVETVIEEAKKASPGREVLQEE